jgi:hypothetical protein
MNPDVHSEDIEGGCCQKDDHLVPCKSTTFWHSTTSLKEPDMLLLVDVSMEV